MAGDILNFDRAAANRERSFKLSTADRGVSWTPTSPFQPEIHDLAQLISKLLAAASAIQGCDASSFRFIKGVS